MNQQRIINSGRDRDRGRAARAGWWLVAVVAVGAALLPATSAWAACNDPDGDGYGFPGDPACSNGPAADCNNSNPNIHPGATELCNGVDDDCDGATDEGYTLHSVDIDTNSATVGQMVDLPLGAMCADGTGYCRAEGVVVCRADGLAAECNAVNLPPQVEGPTNDPITCRDLVDNDCDGDADYEDSDCVGPELCDGLDNNTNGQIDEAFPNLGQACTVGLGVCQASGIFICKADGSGTVCNAVHVAPGVEGPPGGPKCGDGVDNDCDGLTDVADPNCLEAEKCDGLDNNNNGQIDEAFPDLGQACTVGAGACQSSGVMVCRADKLGTACNAVPLPAAPEGPSGLTCHDGIDNNCNGAVDLNDPGCGSSSLVATCALTPSICRDCSGWYIIDYDVVGAAPGADIKAELLALDADGKVLATLPVSDGDVANLNAFNYDDDCVSAQTVGGVHQVFAPVPLLRVLVDDGLNKAYAYCSNTPYLEVVEPSGQTVTESAGDVTPVVVAVPLVDPASLKIIVDGVDIVAAMGLNPATAFPGGPYNDTFTLNAKSVAVTDLMVRTAPPGSLSSNTVTFKIQGLGCGGHIVRVEGDPRPGALQSPPAAWCYLDDLADKGSAAGFALDIYTPLENEVIASGDTHVTGQVCHGKNIAEVIVNGFGLDVAGAVVFTPGDGEDVGDLYVYPIDVMLPEMDYRQFLDSGDPQIGSFTHGTNRLVVQATDEEMNATFESRIFAVGPVLAAPTQALRAGVLVENAFNIGVSAAGLDEYFESFNIVMREMLKNKLVAQLEGYTTSATISEDKIGCCDVGVTVRLHDVAINVDDFGVTVTPQDNQIVIEITLPEFYFQADVWGKCCSGGCGFFCWCARKVDTTVSMRGSNIKVSFTITEDIVKGNAQLQSILLESGSYEIAATIRENGSAKCGFSLWSILTLGIKDAIEAIVGAFADLIIPDNFFNSGEIKQQVKNLNGDFGDFKEFRMADEDEMTDAKLKLEFALGEVEITPQGVAASVDATFIPLVIDPEAADIPGTPLTPAPLPQPPLTDTGGNPAKGLTVSVSDDVFNQLLAGLTKTGQLKSSFEHTTTISSFLTTDCDSLPDVAPLFRKARCIGRTHLNDPNICDTTYPGQPFKKAACHDEQDKYNAKLLAPGTDVVTQARLGIPPKIYLDDDPATQNTVECAFQYDEISISIVADRNGTPGLQGAPGSFPPCFGADPSTVTECALWEACLDIKANMSLERGSKTNAEGKTVPTIRAIFNSLDYSLEKGHICGGTTDVETDELIEGTFESPLIDFLTQKLRDNTPELATTGLNFGGHATFSIDAELIALDNDGNPDFADYLGITADIIHNAKSLPKLSDFIECLGGPSVMLMGRDACQTFDFDGDGRVDLNDFAAMQQLMAAGGEAGE